MDNAVNAVRLVICALCLCRTYLIAVIFNGSKNFKVETTTGLSIMFGMVQAFLKIYGLKHIVKINRFSCCVIDYLTYSAKNCS